MSAPVPLEERLLQPVVRQIDALLGPRAEEHSLRLDLLEAVAAELGGFSLTAFRSTDAVERTLNAQDALQLAPAVIAALDQTPIPASLALTSLARAPMSSPERRSNGAYYTDFRLARMLANRSLRGHAPDKKIVDPASGTGILLVAAALEACSAPAEFARFIATAVHAADLSADALRGAKLALASLTSDDAAIAAMSGRLRRFDSLLAGPAAWADVAPDGFDTVIGNPPWEKLKVSRHEHLAANGVERHYGDEYGEADLSALAAARERINAYREEVSQLHKLHGGGEADLYKLFLSLSFHLARLGGELVMLVPAGLIRSHGTAALREHLLDQAGDLRFAVLFNHARFFAIDTRFKFLALHAVLDATAKRPPVLLDHAAGTDTGVEITGSAQIDRVELRRSRPDLSIPEVRSRDEWSLFRTMSGRGQRLDAPDSPWKIRIVREVDMTRERPLFEREARDGTVPLIEGRMVHQHRHSAKVYVSGTGRRAQWDVHAIGEGELRPQFWIDPQDLALTVQERISTHRIGFCDIAGQTNERAMMAARIPAGVACGNKVPTITIDNDEDGALSDLWVAIANSFAFDWLLRRVLTTTVNYFVLRSVPFPALDVHGETARRLIDLSRLIEAAYHDPDSHSSAEQIAQLRAEIDALVLIAYGVDRAGVDLVISDFPLLDRGQVALPGEPRSTVTADLVRQAFLRASRQPADPRLDKRVAEAALLGADAYIPAELARVTRAAIA